MQLSLMVARDVGPHRVRSVLAQGVPPNPNTLTVGIERSLS
jgi:hypothetical protein